VVNGEEPSAFDAVPLRRATPDGPDQAGGGEPPGPAAVAPSDEPASSESASAAPVHDEPVSSASAGDKPAQAGDKPAQAGDEPASSGPAGAEAAGDEAAGDKPTRDEAASDKPAHDEAAGDQPAGGGPTGGGPAATPVRHPRTLVGRGAQALRRLPPPHRIAGSAARRTARWARRPNGRLALIGLFIAVLLALTGAAGAYLVPASAPVDSARPAAQDSNAPGGAGDSPSMAASAPTTVPSAGAELTPPAVPVPSSSAGAPIGVAGARPADALSGWAQHMAGRIDVPPVALQAYGYAEFVVGETTPGCKLRWTTLAAIGKVESNHGSSNNATLYPDGQALPAIVGPALDGKGGRQPVADTDGGQLDNDIKWDHAVGPMQFIPSTWRTQAVDADNDGVRNPNDIDDAALAAANYLCSNGRDLATPGGWWDAIAAYNIPRSYGEAVFAAANNYGTRSGT
jgi:membrane-bound lytic murein transglycosylase B